eukprot:9391178-Lingulodinium_polyedra.AAC.1
MQIQRLDSSGGVAKGPEVWGAASGPGPGRAQTDTEASGGAGAAAQDIDYTGGTNQEGSERTS